MDDRFESFVPGLTSPATRAAAVEPSDEVLLPFFPRAVYVGGAGDLAMRAESGADAIWKNVPAGTLLPFRPTMIRASGTSATHLVVLD